MAPNEPLLAGVGFLAAVVVTLVDGRHAVTYAAVAAAVGLMPSVAAFYGADAVLVLAGAAALTGLAGPLSSALAHRVSWMAGVDPLVPVVAGSEALFGPRSIRVAAAVLVLPAASWVSFNVPLGSASTVSGVLFPAALVWGCAGMRLLSARTLLDIAVGVAALGIAVAAAWFLAAGVDTLSGAMTAAAAAPGAAITAGWLRGRHGAARPARASP
ncbi:MAG TPA: hypothetical protein VG520_09630 [Candidatus Dormibacteraeota bacterium]|jgi:hypothetical protein|nr:hypothetical protein [Candidatus Dormibacteraeota bacterium]